MEKQHLPEGWTIKKIGSIAKVTSGGTPDRSKSIYWNGKYPWITTSLINFGIVRESEEYITEEGLQNSSAKLFPMGTVLMAMYGQGKTRGQVAMLGIEATTNQACAAIISDENKVYSPFLFQNLSSRYVEIRNLSNTGNQENLNGELIKGISIKLPPIPEQQKIVKILSTWDEAIQTTQELIKQLENQKKALMQRLLSGKGKSWQTYQIAELIKQVRRPVKWDDNELYNLISVRRRSGGAFFRESLMGYQILTKDLYTAKKGDFLMSKMQISHGASGLVGDNLDNMKVSGSYIAVVAKNSDWLDMSFFDWYSRQRSFYHLCYTSSYGVHIEKMTFDFNTFLKRTITIPPIEEQTAIVKILNTADAELNETKAYLETLKQQKKGLMQQLLTGKIRVK